MVQKIQRGKIPLLVVLVREKPTLIMKNLVAVKALIEREEKVFHQVLKDVAGEPHTWKEVENKKFGEELFVVDNIFHS